MDYKDTDAVVERNTSIGGILAEVPNVLSEAEVRDLSKNLANLRLKNNVAVKDDFLRHVQSLIRSLNTTLASNKILLGHGAATCDALCGLLELCEASSNNQIRALAFDCSMWTQTFETYLTSSDYHKSKPMRHLLSTLAKIAFKYPDGPRRAFLIRYAVSSALNTIDGDYESSSVKAAVQVLEHYLNKNIINASQLISILNEKGESGYIDITTGILQNFDLPGTSERKWVSLTDGFVSSILQWVQYPDAAPSSSRLISSFFISLQKHLVQHKSQDSNDQALPLWFSPIRKALNEEPELLEGLKKHILPGLLRLSSADTQAFLEILPLQDLQDGIVGTHIVGDTQLCLLTVKIVVELGTGHDPQSSLLKGRNPNLPDLQNLGIKLLVHASPEIRIAALDLAIYSRSSTEPVSREVLDILRLTLPHFHAEVNPKVRNEFLNQMKRLCTRLRSSIYSLSRAIHHSNLPLNGKNSPPHRISIQCNGKDPDADKSLARQIFFLSWYSDFLTSEMRPTCSYQRHITALRMLYFLLQPDLDPGPVRLPANSASDRFTELSQTSILNPRLLRCVLDLMLDPFDDVRHGAAGILELIPPPLLTTQVDGGETLGSDSRRLLNALYRAESIMRDTGRADHADGVGRLYSLLYKASQNNVKSSHWYNSRASILGHILEHLEHDILVARNRMRRAVAEYPLLGYLIALRYIINRPDFYDSLMHDEDAGLGFWEQLHQRLFRNCEDVWEVVRGVLCIDSPEGRGSEEDEMDGLDIGTKEKLSFSWRALKESSSLCHAMLANPAYGPPGPKVGLRREKLQKIGALAFTQLAELRHRGAFSTVSQTFAACCILCAQRKSPSITELPRHWYQDALASIQQNAMALTRRSAGIPSMITGILEAFPTGDFFTRVILDLQVISKEPIRTTSGEKEVRLPQVHALNCLKDIFTDTRLGPGTEPQVAETLDIAASCIENSIWEIRNCGLMLFKALIRRLNGGTDTSSTRASSPHRRFSKLMYEKYPSLPDLLLKMLRRVDAARLDVGQSEISASIQAQRVFPALEIVEISGLPSQHNFEIKKLIWHHMESLAWPIREKAAKALALVLKDEDRHADIQTLLRPDWPSQNALHGRLLHLRCITPGKSRGFSDKSSYNFESLLPLLEDRFDVLVLSNKCPFTIAAYLDVVADVLELLIQSGSGFSRPFALKCGDSLSKRWPVTPPLRVVGMSSKGPSSSLLAIALERCLRLINKACCSTVQATPVLESLTLGKTTTRENDPISSPFVTDTVGPNKPQHKGPQDLDQTLRQEGSLIAQKYVLKSNDGDTQNQLSAWIRALCLAGKDRSEFSTRMAAVDSIKDFMIILQAHDSTSEISPELLDVYLTLYDALIDDDEDVRDNASEVVSSFLSVSSSSGEPGRITSLSLGPLAASSRLVQFLVSEYKTSVSLWSKAVQRLAGAPSSATVLPTWGEAPILQLRQVQTLLQKAMHTDNALFVAEKQNLFIDEVKEAESWASVLTNLHSKAEARSTSTLETWVLDGISALTALARDKVDGPLGWTSKPEVFTIGMRVILVAKVLLHGPGINDSLIGKEKCRDALRHFLKVGMERLLHGLWLCGIKEALGGDVSMLG